MCRRRRMLRVGTNVILSCHVLIKPLMSNLLRHKSFCRTGKSVKLTLKRYKNFFLINLWFKSMANTLEHLLEQKSLNETMRTDFISLLTACLSTECFLKKVVFLYSAHTPERTSECALEDSWREKITRNAATTARYLTKHFGWVHKIL